MRCGETKFFQQKKLSHDHLTSYELDFFVILCLDSKISKSGVHRSISVAIAREKPGGRWPSATEIGLILTIFVRSFAY